MPSTTDGQRGLRSDSNPYPHLPHALHPNRPEFYQYLFVGVLDRCQYSQDLGLLAMPSLARYAWGTNARDLSFLVLQMFLLRRQTQLSAALHMLPDPK